MTRIRRNSRQRQSSNRTLTQKEVSTSNNAKRPHQVIVIGAEPTTTMLKYGRLWRSSTVANTQRQIHALVSTVHIPDGLRDVCTNQAITWQSYENTFTHLVRYREMQERPSFGMPYTPMSSRPPIVVVAVDVHDGQNCVVQLDVFEGHDFLSKERLIGSMDCEYLVPDFTDGLNYGLRIPIGGMVKWFAGDFQHSLIERFSARPTTPERE